jgi:hypothetical protein
MFAKELAKQALNEAFNFKQHFTDSIVLIN